MAISAEWNGYCAKLHKNQFSALSLQGWIDPKYSYLPNEHGYKQLQTVTKKMTLAKKCANNKRSTILAQL